MQSPLRHYFTTISKIGLDIHSLTWYNTRMKYAIRHIGSSDFLSGFDRIGDPEWVLGWDHADMLLYSTVEEATKDLELVVADGFMPLIEEIK